MIIYAKAITTEAPMYKKMGFKENGEFYRYTWTKTTSEYVKLPIEISYVKESSSQEIWNGI